ncbi:MAG: phage tail assembly protein [Aquincola sp.]|nr:phage tail assembly protein [Aquincola sp.]
MPKLTHTGTLPIGVEVDGVRHTAFELREPTVDDNIQAIEEVGSTNSVALSAAIYSRQLVALGTLQPKEITLALVRGMHPRDFDAIDQAALQLEKKVLDTAASSTGG